MSVQIREDGGPAPLAEVAPPNVVTLARFLDDHHRPLRRVRYLSAVDQVLEAESHGLTIRVVADRGDWFVTLRTLRGSADIYLEDWRSASLRSVPSYAAGADLADEDLAWLLSVLDGSSGIDLAAVRFPE